MSLELSNPNECQHLSPRGQRCHMLRVAGQSFCTYHLHRAEAAAADPEVLAADLLDGTGNLNTADRVNALLANTVKQLARQRIDRQDALAIGYLAQLLLNTVPGVQKEYQAIRAAEAKQSLRKSFTEAQARLRHQPPASEPNVSVRQFAATNSALLKERSAPRGASDSSPEPSEEALLAAVLQATSPQRT